MTSVHFPGIQPGLSVEREYVVSDRMVTRHTGGTGVLSTPHMIGMMEDVAAEVTRPHIGPDHTTVGYEVSIRHRAPTPPGGRVTIRAELLEADGRKLLFRVEAHNERGVIGEGTHRRTIVRVGALDRSAGR